MTIDPQCFDCKHRHVGVGRMACDAFPDDIPDAILSNEHDHRFPYEGDNGIRFEPVPGGQGLSTPPNEQPAA